MKINALLPWFGAKRAIADRIVEVLGKHRAYWEIFCGSCAVLMAKPECSQETVNDLHGDLINLARVIRHDHFGPWLYRKLRRTLVHEDLYREESEKIKQQRDWLSSGNDSEPNEVSAQRAYAYFVSSWLGRNGVIGTKLWNNNFCVRYTSDGGIQGTRFVSAVESIPAWRRRIREVTILRRNAFELLANIKDESGTALYCDPPYLEKGATYRHDFAAEDHERLADLLKRFRKARVVVSYYDHPKLGELYSGWQKINCTVAKSMVQSGRRDQTGRIDAPEVLLVNQETERLLFPMG